MLNNVRVKYAKLDSTSKECNEHFKKLGMKFDFIIDDGLHTPDAQRKTFENNRIYRHILHRRCMELR